MKPPNNFELQTPILQTHFETLEAPARPAGVATDAVCYNTAMLAYQTLALQGVLGLTWRALRAAMVFEGQCFALGFWLRLEHLCTT